MLYKETVSTNTLELLKDLISNSTLNHFFLVGGTALSLQIGHRISVDIYLFSQIPFDENEISEYLETEKGLLLQYISKNTIKGTINNIKVDLISHIYPLVDNLSVIEGIRLCGIRDIAAMKLNAIAGNGTRLKDFVDIAFLSDHLSLRDMVNAYEIKYKSRNPAITIKALAFHEDINKDEPIQLVNQPYKWEPIKKRLFEMIKYPDKVFIEKSGLKDFFSSSK